MISWKHRISKDGEYIDLQGLPNYILRWDENCRVLKVYEYDIIEPCPPPDEFIINYGLDIKDQIFRKTVIPKQVLNPGGNFGRETWSQKDVDSFIDAEWNRRRNGLWFFIKGRRTYIPGILYMKMNYWKSITGVKFIYKLSEWEMAMFYFHSVRDPLCDGIDDFKCRQAGDTEWAILFLWEFGSRVRGTLNFNQSCINEGHAKKTYLRLVYGHKKMIYYFRPLNQGTEDPKKGLNLSYPAQHITHSSVKQKVLDGEVANKSSSDDYEYPEIGSQFYFGPSKVNEFDGTTAGRAYLDEFGKDDGKLNPVEWIQVIREATYSKILGRKMGFIIMTTTVEQVGPESIKQAMTIWHQSDPTKRGADGKTANGLYRCFRNAVDRGEVDHWGDPLREQIIEKINSAIKMLIDAGDIRGAISYRRKNCLTVEDMFAGASDDSQFDVDNLAKRMFYLQNVAPAGTAVRGNFKWKDNIRDTVVVWEPNRNGRWLVSKHPADFGLDHNAKVKAVVSPKPDNTNHFCAAVDPIDQESTLESDEERSKGAIAVKARLNDIVDSSKDLYYQFTDESRGIRAGDPVNGGEQFVTNRFVCTYLYRHADPVDFFEDVIMTMIYYGTDFLPEKDRFGGLHTYLKNRGYELYLMEKPTSFKNYRGQTEQHAVSATTGNINTYFEFLTTLTCKWCNTIDHVDLIEQLLTMNWKNRGKRDLGVAAGWAEYAAAQPRMKFTRQEQKTITHFTESYV